MKDILIKELKQKPAIYPFLSDPTFNSQLVSFIIKHEIGTYRDQLFNFLYDTQTGSAVSREALRAEIVTLKDKTGVAIWVEETPSLGIKLAGFKALLNPTLSFDDNKHITRCVIFPESIAKIAALQETELVMVRDWAIADLEAIGQDYDPIEDRDHAIRDRAAITFASLLEKTQLPFIGTHDIVAHIAGLNKEVIRTLSKHAERAKRVLNHFLSTTIIPNQSSLVLTFTIGVLLDRMAQPPNYGKKNAEIILDNLLTCIEREQVSPKEFFPIHYDTLMETAFYSDNSDVAEQKAQEATLLFLDELGTSTFCR